MLIMVVFLEGWGRGGVDCSYNYGHTYKQKKCIKTPSDRTQQHTSLPYRAVGRGWMKPEGEDASAAKAEGSSPEKLHPVAECCCSSSGSRTSCPAAPPCGCRRPQGEKIKTNVDQSVTESKAGDIHCGAVVF